jgi:tRNA (Thr-GGU) A37 N-methylase
VTEIHLIPIGYVRGGRAVVEDDDWGTVTARIELDPAVVEPTSTSGLDDFSHIEVVFQFDRIDEAGVCRGARHPRGREDWPLVGILGQRAKDRPNRIGLTTCEVRAVGKGWIDVAGLDAVDGTPVIDVKPYMHGFAPRGEVREPAWAAELMAGYW